jgi:hypothetical protein
VKCATHWRSTGFSSAQRASMGVETGGMKRQSAISPTSSRIRASAAFNMMRRIRRNPRSLAMASSPMVGAGAAMRKRGRGGGFIALDDG